MGNGINYMGGNAFGSNPSLTAVYFPGNAPTGVDGGAFASSDPKATIYYLTGTAGWGTTFAGLPAVLLVPPDITVQPQSQTVNAGEDATFTVAADSAAPLSYQWLLNGAAIGGATASSYTVIAPPEGGSYSVAVSNFAGSVTSAAARLTVQLPSATVSIASGLTANDKIYDATTTATLSSNNVVLAGVLAADAGNVGLSTNGYTAAFATSAVGAGRSVTVSGLSLTGSAAANYWLIQPSLTANITAATVTIASGLAANNKIYDGTTSATLSSNNVVLAGILPGDVGSVALSTNGYTAAFASAGSGAGQSVTVSGLSLTGAAAANYSLIQPSLTANITAGVPVTISSGLTANNKMYDGTTSATLSSNNVVLAGVLPGDVGNVALSTNGYTATFASAGPGTSISVSVSGLGLIGSAAGNYSLIQPSLAANITPPVVTANPLLFTAGTTSGAQFSQVLAPIYVDLLTNILSFQFSLHWDPTVATYVDVERFGLPGLGAGSFGTTLSGSGTLTVSWDDLTGFGQSLGDGTAVFAVRFALTGSEGASSSVMMNGTPTALQAANSDLTLVPVQTVPGQLSVAVAPTVAIGGQVMYYPTNYPPSGPSEPAVAGVTVSLTGAANLNQATATDGSYSFPGLAAGLDYEASPARSDDEPPANGVSTLGIALIRRQILDLAPLASPYALLAADVNASGTVDTLDIAWIRRLILAVTNTFPAGLWRFVPADYLFPDASNPWGAPSSRSYTNLSADMTGQDYVAIKLGDVNHSWTKAEIGKAESRNLAPDLPAVRFEARGRVAQPRERVGVRVSVGGFTGGTTAQFTLGWDARVLQYAGVGEFGVRGLGGG